MKCSRSIMGISKETRWSKHEPCLMGKHDDVILQCMNPIKPPERPAMPTDFRTIILPSLGLLRNTNILFIFTDDNLIFFYFCRVLFVPNSAGEKEHRFCDGRTQ